MLPGAVGPGQVARGRHVQLVGHRHTFAVVQQGDGQVVGHALLIVGKQHMAADGEVGLLHQLLQVFHGNSAEGGEILAAIEVFLQPAAERVRAGLGMEETPGLALFGVIALVEVGEHVLDGSGLGQFRVTGMENCGRAVGFCRSGGRCNDGSAWASRLVERGAVGLPEKSPVYRTRWSRRRLKRFREASDDPYAFFHGLER